MHNALQLLQGAPYLMRKANATPGSEEYYGYCADLAKKIANFVGFEYEIHAVKDGKFGQKDINNTWNGMVGELVRHVSFGDKKSHVHLAT